MDLSAATPSLSDYPAIEEHMVWISFLEEFLLERVMAIVIPSPSARLDPVHMFVLVFVFGRLNRMCKNSRRS